ncbi:hypothetical protein ACA910_016511 [Epithemia clementina (nom. ined.)]
MSRRGSSIFTAGGAGGPAAGGQPMAGGIGLVDFDDSDYESEEEAPQQAPAPKPPVNNGAGAGGPNHRPLVGGFAAAAYEAARAQHYAEQQKKKAMAAKQAEAQGSAPRQSGRK